jgi:hypothetical protein
MVPQTIAVSHPLFSDYTRFRLCTLRLLIRYCTLVTRHSMQTHCTYHSDSSAIDIRYLTPDAWIMTRYLATVVE